FPAFVLPYSDPDAHASISFFFFTAPTTTEIYTLSLHDALPIFPFELVPGIRDLKIAGAGYEGYGCAGGTTTLAGFIAMEIARIEDRKSTRLNSSHVAISYAVFCLKKKTTHIVSIRARVCRLRTS